MTQTLIQKIMQHSIEPNNHQKVVPDNRWDADVRQLALFKLWRAYINAGYHPKDFVRHLSTDHGTAIVHTALRDARNDILREMTTQLPDEVGRTMILSLDTPQWVDDATGGEPQWLDSILAHEDDLHPSPTPSLDTQAYLDQSEYLQDIYDAATSHQKQAIEVLIRMQWRREEGLAPDKRDLDRLTYLRKCIQQQDDSWVLKSYLLEVRGHRAPNKRTTKIIDNSTFQYASVT